MKHAFYPPPPSRRRLADFLIFLFVVSQGFCWGDVYYLNNYTVGGESWNTTYRWTLYGDTQTYQQYKGLNSLDVNGTDLFLVGTDSEFTYDQSKAMCIRTPEAPSTIFPGNSSLYIGYVWDETTSSPRLSKSSNRSWLQLKAANTTIDNLYFGNGMITASSSGGLTLNGTATIEGSNVGLDAGTDRWIILNSKIKGAGNLSANVHDKGMFIRGDNSEFTGNWGISLVAGVSSGYLQVGDATTTSSLGSGTVTVDDGCTLVFQAPGDMTAGNAISGAGNVEWRGAGRLTLGGESTYSGSTVVTNGSLAVDGSLDSLVTMKEGTHFDILSENGTLGGLTLENRASINAFLERGMNPLTIAGILTLGNDSQITFQYDEPLTGGLAFEILSAAEIVKTDGSVVDWSQILDFSQVGGASLWNYVMNDGTLSVSVDSAAVPEPSSWILLLGMGMACFYQWRRNIPRGKSH